MSEPLFDTAIFLTQRQIVALERGDFDAYTATLPEYSRVCAEIESLSATDLRVSRRQLELLMLGDARAREALSALMNSTQSRISSLQRATKVADAYLAGSGPRIATRRQA